jgi:hypothetical protein
MAIEEPMLLEEQSLTLHNSQYNEEEKKFQIEKVSVKNNKVIHKKSLEFNVSGVRPSRLLKLHFFTGDTLSHSILEQESEILS